MSLQDIENFLFTAVSLPFSRDIPRGSKQSRPIQSNPPLFFSVARATVSLALLLPVPRSPNVSFVLCSTFGIVVFSFWCYCLHFVLCVCFFLVAQQALLHSFGFLFVSCFCSRCTTRTFISPPTTRRRSCRCA